MTTLWIIAGVWIVVALAAALWVGAAMRRAEQGEQHRLAEERAREAERPGTDDVRTA